MRFILLVSVIMSALVFKPVLLSAQMQITSQPTEGTETFLNGRWELLEIDNQKIDAGSFMKGIPYMDINIKAHTVRGNTGCNSFSGTVTSDGGKITFEKIVSTRMMCAYQIDNDFFDVLQKCNNYYIDQGILSLKSDEAIRALFRMNYDSSGYGGNDIRLKKYFEDIGFYAIGHEPEWSIDLRGAGTADLNYYSCIENDEYKIIKTFSELRSDTMIVTADQDSSEMIITIIRKECSDLISGKKYPYEVTVTADNMTLTGCGEFTGYDASRYSYNINDIWVIEKLGDETLDRNDFKNGMPLLEIHADRNNFSGNTGCNSMNGKFMNIGNLIKFENIATTRMMCPGGYDALIISALTESDNFEIDKLKLFLRKGQKILAVLQKID